MSSDTVVSGMFSDTDVYYVAHRGANEDQHGPNVGNIIVGECTIK